MKKLNDLISKAPYLKNIYQQSGWDSKVAYDWIPEALEYVYSKTKLLRVALNFRIISTISPMIDKGSASIWLKFSSLVNRAWIKEALSRDKYY